MVVQLGLDLSAAEPPFAAKSSRRRWGVGSHVPAAPLCAGLDLVLVARIFKERRGFGSPHWLAASPSSCERRPVACAVTPGGPLAAHALRVTGPAGKLAGPRGRQERARPPQCPELPAPAARATT